MSADVQAAASVAEPKIAIETFWLPKQLSDHAADVDRGWDAAYWVSIGFFVLIVGAMVYFVYKYKRRSENDITSDIDHNVKLEVAWTVVPTVILIALFFVGLTGYVNASVSPADAFEINVTARKWGWSFAYPNGKVADNMLIVPKGKPVRLVMSSVDVIHGFYSPELRLKSDVIPGTYTTLWFEAKQTTETAMLCTQYCGAPTGAAPGASNKFEYGKNGHSDMLATIKVIEPAEFTKWLLAGECEGCTPEEYGAKLFASKGCQTCHSMEGAKIVGPALNGIAGTMQPIEGGPDVMADDNYLRESILVPGAKLVKGFPNVMPPQQGQLNEEQVRALIAFLKSKK